MFTSYGYFKGDGSEFVITEREIERNWYNYCYTDSYISFTSHVGIGQAFLQDDMGNRLMSTTERGVYVVDGETGWSLAGLPVYEPCEHYSCTHGIGYTKINLHKNQLATEYGYFVPCEESKNAGYEVLWVKVKNVSGQKKTVKVLSYNGNNFDGAYTYQGYNTMKNSKDELVNGLHFNILRTWNGEKRHFESFLVCGQPVSGYDCTRNAFIGAYGSIADPRALHKGGCSNTNGVAEKLCFALETTVELEPMEEKFVSFVCGLTENTDRVQEITKRFSTLEQIETELEKVKEKYNQIMKGVSIETPDQELNQLFNSWLKYETNMGSRWARVRHNGYRDIVSDTECLAAFHPTLAWERFKRILTYQYSNGYAPRTFSNGVIKDNNFSDCTVWLTFAAYTIVNEIGDLSLLEEEVVFNDGSVATVYEHLRRSVEFLYNFKGHHGLIRIWGGDWNDCMNEAGLGGKGVSIWLSIAWYRANRQFVELAKMCGRVEDVAKFTQMGEEMKELVDTYGWDEEGGYYIYAISDDMHKIGAHDCEEGSMYLNPQLWAVMSGISKNGKELVAMEHAEKILGDDLGVRVHTPAYTSYVPYIGEVTRKAPGIQENGGVYLHAMTWKLAVDGMLGRRNLVERDMNDILPFRNSVVAGRAEPYVLCNCYMGKETGARYGTPGQSWRTASGQWFLKAMLQYVFGLQPTIEGLEVHPCLPESWETASVIRKFRECIYHISYKQTGTASIHVDGKNIKGNLLPYEKNKEFDVIVTF